MKLMQCILLLSLQTNIHSMEPLSTKKTRPSQTLTLSLPLPNAQKNTARPRSLSTSRSYEKIESTLKNINSAKSFKKPKKKIIMLENQMSNPNAHKNSYLINATRDNNLIKVTEMLTYNDLDINHQNEWGNTALHYAAMQKHKEIILLLLHDFRTDASIPNNAGLRARDCFIAEKDNEEDRLIRIALFLRAMLNIAVHEESFATLVGGSIDANNIEKTIHYIKERIDDNYKHQESYQELPTDQTQKTNVQEPKNIYFPDYITDEFIKNMILMKLG